MIFKNPINMKSTISGVIVFFFFLTSHAQSNTPSVLNAGGGTFQSGYFHFEWSIGELALVNQMSTSNNSIIVTNGFIQPYILRPGALNINAQFGNDEIKVFPNPASDYAEINFFTKQQGKIKINMYDVSGKCVWSGSLMCYGVDLIERISLGRFENSSYMLKIDLEANPGFSSKHGVYKIVKVK